MIPMGATTIKNRMAVKIGFITLLRRIPTVVQPRLKGPSSEGRTTANDSNNNPSNKGQTDQLRARAERRIAIKINTAPTVYPNARSELRFASMLRLKSS